MPRTSYDIILIGGSAGSITVITSILDSLPSSLHIPVIIILHRQRNVNSEMAKLLQTRTQQIPVTEPEDKEPVIAGHIYLAPQNYHLLIEQNKVFSLDYSELIHFSRPSIDVTFDSTAKVYGAKTLAVLLSGANKDGTKGVESVIQNKGTVIVQDPATAEYPVMVNSAIDKCKAVMVLTPHDIVRYIANLSTINE